MKKIFKTLALAVAGALFMASCDDVPAPYNPGGNGGGNEGKEEQPAGEGTLASPYNVAKANEVVKALEQSTSKDDAHYSDEVYVKGIVSVVDSVSLGYGNATYRISADGEADGQLQIYRGYGFDGARFTKEDDIKKGDTLIVYGKLVNWKGNYQFNQGSKIVYQNGKTVSGGDTPSVEPAGKGTESDPYNVAAVLKLYADQSVPNIEVYVKGKISEIRSLDVSKYTRAQYYISDDGKTTNQFYVYNGLYLGGENFTANDQIKVGDEVVVCGTLTSYNGTDEFAQNSKIVSLNGKKADGGQGGEVTPGTPKGVGSQADPYNVAGAIAYIKTLSAEDKPETLVYTKGQISEVVKLGTSGSIQFKMSDSDVDNSLLVYYCNNLGNKAFEALDDLKAGDEVVVCGKVVNYNGNTPEYVAGAYLVSLNGKTEQSGGSDQPGDAADVSMLMSAAYSECTNGNVDATPVTVDGVTVSFDQNGGNNPPKYYWNKTADFCAVRMYAKNTMTVKAGKNIAKVVITCAAKNGSTLYNGNEQMTTSAGAITKASDNVTVTIDGINNSEVTVTNDFTAISGGTQLRVVNLEVFYAK